MATLPGAWRHRVSAGTGQPSVSLLWLGEMNNLICNFYLSVAARKIVWADPSQRCTLACCWDITQPTNTLVAPSLPAVWNSRHSLWQLSWAADISNEMTKTANETAQDNLVEMSAVLIYRKLCIPFLCTFSVLCSMSHFNCTIKVLLEFTMMQGLWQYAYTPPGLSVSIASLSASLLGRCLDWILLNPLKSYQWLRNGYFTGYPARCLAWRVGERTGPVSIYCNFVG